MPWRPVTVFPGVDIARAIYGRTRGQSIGELYTSEDPIPVLVRSEAGEAMAVSELQAVDVPTSDSRMIPLGQVAHVEPVWQPAAIKHRNGQRLTTVSAQLKDGVSFFSGAAGAQGETGDPEPAREC